jgi:hypothetical protein
MTQDTDMPLADERSAGPLQTTDDLLGHQTAMRACRPAIADTDVAIFTERYWYMGMDAPEGRIVFGAGLGCYTNRGVMDGYAGVTVDGVQHVFQGSRHLGDRPLQTEVGPLAITVEEGMRTHRIQLKPNGSGLALDLVYRAAFEPNDEGLDTLVKHERLVSQTSRFVQFGHYVGWIDVRGRRLDFTPERPLWGARDRSWGLRSEARTDETHPPVTQFRPLLFAWVCAQFPDSGVHFFLKESAPGETRFFVGDETYALGGGAPAKRIVAAEHELEWSDDAYSQHIRAGHFVLHYADGSRQLLELRALPGRFYLKGGLYGGYRGWFQGDDKGPLHLSHAVWNHADPATRRELRTLAEQVFEFRLGDRVGYGTIQAGLSAGYPKYQAVQHLPIM